MQNYKQMYQDAQKSGRLKHLTPVYQEWKKSGDQIIGAFVSKGLVDSSRGGQQYYQYVFATDQGNVKFSLGRAADIDVGAAFREGVIYAIEFQGKEDIGGGRSVNKFDIFELGTVTDYGPESAD